MEKNKPIIIAHRGASAYAPENTMAAFNKAYELKADGIEFDVKCSKDGEVIIIHDQTLNRTTNGSGRVVETILDDLRKLDAGSSFSSEFAGEKIPLLREVLEVYGGTYLLNIELTNYESIGDGLAKKVCQLLKDLNIERNIIFSSFHPYNLLVTRRLLPMIPTALLTLPGKKGRLTRSNLFRWLSPRYIHPYYHDADAKYIELQHRYSRKVNVWTVNEEVDIKNFIENNVDGIITDDPLLAKTILGL